MNLTPKQMRIFNFVRQFRVMNGYSPTLQEIADELAVSKVTVFEHVESLVEKGALKRNPNKARSLSEVEDAVRPDEGSGLSIPLLGRIAAGMPIERCAQDENFSLKKFSVVPQQDVAKCLLFKSKANQCATKEFSTAIM